MIKTRLEYLSVMQVLGAQKDLVVTIDNGDNTDFRSLRQPGGKVIPLNNGTFNLTMKRTAITDANATVFSAPGVKSRYVKFSKEAILEKFDANDVVEKRGTLYFKANTLERVMDWVIEIQSELNPTPEVSETDIQKFVATKGQPKTKKKSLSTRLNKEMA